MIARPYVYICPLTIVKPALSCSSADERLRDPRRRAVPMKCMSPIVGSEHRIRDLERSKSVKRDE